MKQTLSCLIYCGLLFLLPSIINAEEPKKFHGICFGAYRDKESPHTGLFPLPSTLKQDVAFAAKLATALRTYSVANTHYLIPEFCRESRIDCYPGCWLGRSAPHNNLEIELLVRLGRSKNKRIKALIVGNEPLHRKDFSEKQYIRYIRKVKKKVKVPVTAAETWSVWNKHPRLAAEVDFLIIHVYPYWDRIPIEKAAEYTLKRVQQLQKQYPKKKIVLGEFGWPSAGKRRGPAVTSLKNQARYLKEILPLLQKHEIAYFYFSLWDEKWKVRDEGEVGAHWGLFRSDGSPKDPLRKSLPKDAAKGSRRPPRDLNF